MIRRRSGLLALVAGGLIPFLIEDKAAPQPIGLSPEAAEQRRNRRMMAEREVGGGPVPIPVAPESGGTLTRLDQPTVFFLLKEPIVADIDISLQRSGDARSMFRGSVGVKWGRGLHPVHIADTQVHLEPEVPFDWTLTLRRIGHEPAGGGATIMYRPPPSGFTEHVAALSPEAAIDTLLQANYWYDAFLLGMQSPPDIRARLIRELLARANIDLI
jgi:hypothetical protein